MTLEVFPKLSGLVFGTTMTPAFSTGVFRASNGSETRNSYQQYPLWDFELSYEWLPNRKEGRRDLERIAQFFLERRGSFEAFLFDGPETAMEDMTLIGTGDGTETTFTLIRTEMGLGEPIGGLVRQEDLQLYVNENPVDNDDFSLVNYRDVVFDIAPQASTQIRAIYTPLFRVRFKDDTADFSQFMSRLWELQKIDLKGVFS